MVWSVHTRYLILCVSLWGEAVWSLEISSIRVLIKNYLISQINRGYRVSRWLNNCLYRLKENLPYEYSTFGKQMRTNIDYESNSARKRSELDYRPMFDPTMCKWIHLFLHSLKLQQSIAEFRKSTACKLVDGWNGISRNESMGRPHVPAACSWSVRLNTVS